MSMLSVVQDAVHAATVGPTLGPLPPGSTLYMPPPGSADIPSVLLPGTQQWVPVTTLHPAVQQQVQQQVLQGTPQVGLTANGGKLLDIGAIPSWVWFVVAGLALYLWQGRRA